MDAYRDYIAGSRGEFTVAKDQNVRLRSGWFSDRSATYLAAGRPVITQDTGFSNVLPTGEGLFGFSTMEEILAAVEAINSDYERHSRAADGDRPRVLRLTTSCWPSCSTDIGLERPARRGLPRASSRRPVPRRHGRSRRVSRRPTRAARCDRADRAGRPVPAPRDRVAGRAPVGASIVVVAYDNLALHPHVPGERARGPRTPAIEVVVVDNGSTDGTPAYLRELARARPRVRLVLNADNGGFARASNQGLAARPATSIVLLNNDTLVPPGWLDAAARRLADPGDRPRRPGHQPDRQRGGDRRSIRDLGRAARVRRRARAASTTARCFDIGTLTMFCLAMRREVFERIGPLDQRFEIGHARGRRLLVRARQAGYRAGVRRGRVRSPLRRDLVRQARPDRRATGSCCLRTRSASRTSGDEPWQPYGRRLEAALRGADASASAVVADALPPEGDGARRQPGRRGAAGARRPLRLALPGGRGRQLGRPPPADSGEAVALLEEMRERGGAFVLFPRPASGGSTTTRASGAPREPVRDVVRDEETASSSPLNGRQPSDAEPRCSIVIPVHGRAGLTRQCLDAILGEPPAGAVRGGRRRRRLDGRDGELLRRLRGAGARRRADAERRASRRPATTARRRRRGDYLVFLNNDTIPQRGLAGRACASRRAPGAGGRGQRSCCSRTGPMQHAGVVICQDAQPAPHLRRLSRRPSRVNRSRAFQAVTAACMLVRRDALRAGRRLRPGLPQRPRGHRPLPAVRQAGDEVHYCHESVLYHLESVSRGRGSQRHRAQLRVVPRALGRRPRATTSTTTWPTACCGCATATAIRSGWRSAPELPSRQRDPDEVRDSLERQSAPRRRPAARGRAADAACRRARAGQQSPRETVSGPSSSGPAPNAERGPPPCAGGWSCGCTISKHASAAASARTEHRAGRSSVTGELLRGHRQALVAERAREGGNGARSMSRGVDEALDSARRQGWHFPQEADGTYAGRYPLDSDEAVAQLEELRERGAGYLLVPGPSAWWLDHYEAFGRHLSGAIPGSPSTRGGPLRALARREG